MARGTKAAGTTGEHIVTIITCPLAGAFADKPKGHLGFARLYLEECEVPAHRVSNKDVGSPEILYAGEATKLRILSSDAT
jgi:hypothetical protein